MARDTEITVRLRDRFSKGMSRLGRGVRGLRNQFFNMRTAILGVVAAFGAFRAASAVKNFLGGALNVARDFESQMSTVRAVTGATGEEFEMLEAAAREAGATMGRFTAAEAGAGLEELSRAGFSAREAVDALSGVLQFAQANSIAVADAATQVTTTLNQFGFGAEQASLAADVLTRAAQRSATDVEQLGNAMSYAAPLARQAGVSLEETTAIIGALADQGFRGERAGTALRQAFALLQDPASKVSRALNSAGIQTRNFSDVLAELEGSSEKAKQVMLSLPLEVRPAIAALVEGGTSRIRELTAEFNNAEGAAADASAVMEDNLDGALDNLKSAWDTAKESLLEPVMGPLADEVRNLTDGLRKFAESPAFDRLKEDLLAGFRDAAEAVRNFISEFDFEAATERLGNFVRTTGQKTDEIINKIRIMGRTMQGIGAGIRIAFNGLDVAVSKTVETFAFAVRKIFELDNVIAEKIPGWRKHTEDLAIAQDVERRAAERAAEAKRDLGEAVADLSAAMDPLGGQTEAVAESLEKTGDAGKKAKEGLDQAAEGIENVKGAAEGAPETITQMEQALNNMSVAYKESAQFQKDQREELERQNPTLRDTGNEIQNVSDQTETWNNVTKSWEEATKKAGDETEKTADKSKQLGEQSERTAEQVESSADSFESAKSGAQGVGQAIADIVARYRELGGSIGELGETLVKEAGRLPQTITAFFRNLGRELDRAEDQYQRNIEHFERWRTKLEAGEATASEFANAINQIGGEAALLDKQRLDFFRQQLQQARQDAAALRREISETTADIEAQLLRAQGKESELIERRFANKRRELELLLESTTDQAQKTKLREALRNLEELEEIELRKIRERNEAEREANQETHRQREADATDFHEGELGRADERAQANAGAVANFNEAEAEAEARHKRELQRIEERKETEVRAFEEIREARERALGSAQGAAKGAMAVGAGEGGRMQIDLRVLSDALNGQGLTIGPQALEQLTEGIVRRLLVGASTSGTRRVN